MVRIPANEFEQGVVGVAVEPVDLDPPQPQQSSSRDAVHAVDHQPIGAPHQDRGPAPVELGQQFDVLLADAGLAEAAIDLQVGQHDPTTPLEPKRSGSALTAFIAMA